VSDNCPFEREEKHMTMVIPEAQSAVLGDDSDTGVLPAPKIEEGDEVVEIFEKKPDLKAEKPEAAATAKPEKPEPNPEDEIPEQYRGKTPAQLAKMLADSQSLIGRQGQELGDLRRKADQYIQASLQLATQRREAPAAPAAAAPAKPAPIDEADFFAKPMDAVQRAIEQSPVIQEIRRAMGDNAKTQAVERAMAAQQRFQAAHPDAEQILGDPEFRKWVEASNVRRGLLQRAHLHYDFDAGDEVFGTWKALKGVGKAAPAAEDPAAAAAAASEAGRTLAAQRKKQAASAAAVPSGGGGGGPAQGGGSKKIYRRADVLQLMETDPERYERLAPEITLAYQEGRVR